MRCAEKILTVATAPVYFFGIINFKMNGHRTSWKMEKLIAHYLFNYDELGLQKITFTCISGIVIASKRRPFSHTALSSDKPARLTFI